MLLTAFISPIAQADSISGRQCDELASSPYSKDRPIGVKGVKTKDINSTLATSACKQAVAEEPNIARYQYQLARAYYKAKQYDEVLRLFQVLTDQGYAPAQAGLGHMYANGKGVVQDYKKAFELYQKSANQGFAYAQSGLAYMYEQGLGATQDYKKALYWYKKSAEQGEAMGQNNLGIMYEEGKGVAQDYKKAIKWYRKSANQGFSYAKERLIILKEQGIY